MHVLVRAAAHGPSRQLEGVFSMTSSVAALKPQAPTVKMLLDGKFIDSKSTEWHDVVNPATQEVLAQVPFATDA